MDAEKNSNLAEEYGNAHENKPKNPAKSMDLRNNSVGYSLGIKAIENEWSDGAVEAFAEIAYDKAIFSPPYLPEKLHAFSFKQQFILDKERRVLLYKE